MKNLYVWTLVCLWGSVSQAASLSFEDIKTLGRQVELLTVALPLSPQNPIGDQPWYWGRTPEGRSCSVRVLKTNGTDFQVLMQQGAIQAGFTYGPAELSGSLFGVPVYKFLSSFRVTSTGIQASSRVPVGYFESRKSSIKIDYLPGEILNVAIKEGSTRLECRLNRAEVCGRILDK